MDHANRQDILSHGTLHRTHKQVLKLGMYLTVNYCVSFDDHNIPTIHTIQQHFVPHVKRLVIACQVPRICLQVLGNHCACNYQPLVLQAFVIWIGPWANFPQYMDPTFTFVIIVSLCQTSSPLKTIHCHYHHMLHLTWRGPYIQPLLRVVAFLAVTLSKRVEKAGEVQKQVFQNLSELFPSKPPEAVLCEAKVWMEYETHMIRTLEKSNTGKVCLVCDIIDIHISE